MIPASELYKQVTEIFTRNKNWNIAIGTATDLMEQESIMCDVAKSEWDDALMWKRRFIQRSTLVMATKSNFRSDADATENFEICDLKTGMAFRASRSPLRPDQTFEYREEEIKPDALLEMKKEFVRLYTELPEKKKYVYAQ